MAKTFIPSDEIIQKVITHHKLGNMQEINHLEGGFGNPVVLVNKTYVIKFNKGRKKEHLERISREAILYPLLASHKIPAPKLITYDTTKNIVPYYYLILSFLPGEPVTTGYNKQSVDMRKSLAFQIGKTLKTIHEIKKNEITNNIEYFIYATWKERILRDFDDAFTLFVSHGNPISVEQKNAIEAIREKFIDLHEHDIPHTLIHHDFHANHIFTHNGNISGIIDFEWSRFGDPLWDFQKLPIGLSIGSMFFIPDFLKGYGITAFTEKELVRCKLYCFLQAIWQIDHTRFGDGGYPEDAVKKGYQLIDNTIKLAY